MTSQERELLSQLTQRINQTQLQDRDPDAQNLLGRELGANPDAIYILAQTVLVQDIALQQARAQVSQLQSMLEQARQQTSQSHGTSFLGRLLGERDPEPAPPAASRPAAPGQQSGAYPQQPQGWQQQQQPPFQPVQYAPQTPPYGAPQYGGAPAYGAPVYGAPVGQPSFLRGAMQTAAGVAAGALAFEGVESILHGFGHGGGMGLGGMGGGFQRPEETVINNYYDGERPEHHGGDRGFDNQVAGGEDNLRGFETHGNDAGHAADGTQGNFASNDSSGGQNYTGPDEMAVDPGQGSGYLLNDSGDAGQQSDQASIDDGTSLDDGSLDDGGSFDDGGGGFDDGGGFDGGGDNGF